MTFYQSSAKFRRNYPLASVDKVHQMYIGLHTSVSFNDALKVMERYVIFRAELKGATLQLLSGETLCFILESYFTVNKFKVLYDFFYELGIVAAFNEMMQPLCFTDDEFDIPALIDDIKSGYDNMTLPQKYWINHLVYFLYALDGNSTPRGCCGQH